MIVSDRIVCRLFGHRWANAMSFAGPWSFCRRCGETSEAPRGTDTEEKKG